MSQEHVTRTTPADEVSCVHLVFGGPPEIDYGQERSPDGVGGTPARQRSSFGDPRKRWTAAVRRRVADQLPRIRHWRVVHGDYTQAAGLVTAGVAGSSQEAVYVQYT